MSVPSSLLSSYASLIGGPSDAPNQTVLTNDVESTQSVLFPHKERQLNDYVWMVIIGSFVAFFVAFGIGRYTISTWVGWRGI